MMISDQPGKIPRPLLAA